jgi:crotonobetainyl-CoA:carnitine CoA-transferase CaiB-like acyl-CoA transferase
VLALLGPTGADIPVARVASPDELIDDPQLVARGMIERHPHPQLGEVVFHGNALRFSGLAPRERALAPELGEASAAILAEVGVTAAQLAALRGKGVI